MSIANMINNELSANNGQRKKNCLIMTSYTISIKGSKKIITTEDIITSLTRNGEISGIK